MKRRINLDFPSVMTFLLFALLIAAYACGCSTYKSSFTDADGTHYETSMVLAPFSRLEGDDAKLSYTWTAEGSGSINVGRDVNVLDNTPQIDAASVVTQAAVTAFLQYLTSGVRLP